MATRDLSYLIQFDAETGGLRDAEAQVEDLADAIQELSGDGINIDAQVELEGADRAIADVMSLQEELDSFSQEAFIAEMRVDLDQARADVIRFASELEELEEFDLPGVRAGVEAQFAEASQRVQGLEQDLRDLGSAADTVDGSMGSAAGGVDRLGQASDAAASGVDRVRSSSDQTRSVMANLTGNAAQDLASVGGSAGSAGVALSQLVEYAVDGNISLSELGKLAAPMLGVAAAGMAISTAVGGIQAEKAFNAEMVDDFFDSLREGETVAESIRDTIEETGELIYNTGALGGGGFLGLGSQGRDLIPILDDLNISAAQFIELTERPDGAQVLRDLAEEYRNLGFAQGDYNVWAAAGADTYQQLGSSAGVAAQGVEQYQQNAALAEEKQEALNRVLYAGVDPFDRINESIAAGESGRRDVEMWWNNILVDMADGSIETDLAKNAWESLRVELGLTDAQMQDLADQKLDEQMREQADAAEEAAAAFEETSEAIAGMAEATADYAESIGDTNVALGELADSRADSKLAAIRDELDLGDAYVDTIRQINDIQGMLDQLGEFDASEISLDPMNLDAAPFLDWVAQYRDAVQGEIARAFEEEGPEAAVGMAQWYVGAFINEVDGAITKEDAERALGVDDLEARVQVALDEESLDTARASLDELVELVGRTPFTTSVRLAMDAEEISPAAAQVLINAALGEAGVTVPAGLEVNDAQATAEAERWAAGNLLKVIAEVEVESGAADGALAAVTAPRTTTITAGADIGAATGDLDTEAAKERTTTITADADGSLATAVLFGILSMPRTATITAEADISDAAMDLQTLVNQKRTAVVDAILGSFPTAAEIADRIGPVRVRVDGYVGHVPRIDGTSSVQR